MTQPGFEIAGETLPLVDVDAWTLEDGRLVYAYLGKRIASIMDKENDDGEGKALAVLLISVAHAHPDWPQQQVCAFMDKLSYVDLIEATAKAEAAVQVQVEGDAGPPAETAETPESRSTGSSTGSTISAEDTSGAPV